MQCYNHAQQHNPIASVLLCKSACGVVLCMHTSRAPSHANIMCNSAASAMLNRPHLLFSAKGLRWSYCCAFTQALLLTGLCMTYAVQCRPKLFACCMHEGLPGSPRWQGSPTLLLIQHRKFAPQNKYSCCSMQKYALTTEVMLCVSYRVLVPCASSTTHVCFFWCMQARAMFMYCSCILVSLLPLCRSRDKAFCYIANVRAMLPAQRHFVAAKHWHGLLNSVCCCTIHACHWALSTYSFSVAKLAKNLNVSAV